MSRAEKIFCWVSVAVAIGLACWIAIPAANEIWGILRERNQLLYENSMAQIDSHELRAKMDSVLSWNNHQWVKDSLFIVALRAEAAQIPHYREWNWMKGHGE